MRPRFEAARLTDRGFRVEATLATRRYTARRSPQAPGRQSINGWYADETTALRAADAVRRSARVFALITRGNRESKSSHEIARNAGRKVAREEADAQHGLTGPARDP